MEDNTEKLHIVASLDGGMQSATTKFIPVENQVKFAKNVDYNYSIGGIAKALGYSKLGNTINSAAAILGAGFLNTSGGTNKRVAFSGTDAYVYNSATGAWDAQSQTFTAAQNFFTIPVFDGFIEINGITDAPLFYNASTWSSTTNVTDMPKACYGVYLNNRIYLLNINLAVAGSMPSVVWYSDLILAGTAITWGFESGTDLAQSAGSAVVTSAAALFKTRNIKVGDDFYITTGSNAGRYSVYSVDSETQITLTVNLTNAQTSKSFWCGGNYFPLERENGDVGMGLGINSDRILCFKRFSLWRFQKTANSGTDTLIKVNGPGTVSQRSVVNVGSSTFYFADNGINEYKDGAVRVISAAVQEIIDGIAASSLSSIVSWVEDNRVVKMFVGDISNADTDLTVNKCVICYDTQKQTWWIEEYPDTIKVAIQNYNDSGAAKNFIFSSAGECFETATTNGFDTDGINMEVEMHPVFPVSPEVELTYTRARIYTKRGQDIQISYKKYFYEKGRVDQDSRTPMVTFRSENLTEIKFKETDPKSSGMALLFRHMSSDQRNAIERIVFYYINPKLQS